MLSVVLNFKSEARAILVTTKRDDVLPEKMISLSFYQILAKIEPSQHRAYYVNWSLWPSATAIFAITGRTLSSVQSMPIFGSSALTADESSDN